MNKKILLMNQNHFFSKYKDFLTDEDKEYVKLIIEKRKKEIDKQLGENKMKKTLFNLGRGIATLLMFWPLYVILNHEKINFPVIELAISILYCIYMNSVNDKLDRMEKVKKNYYEQLNFRKKLTSEMTDKEIIKYQEKYIENLIDEFF